MGSGNPANVLNEILLIGQSLASGFNPNGTALVNSVAAYPGVARMFTKTGSFGVRLLLDSSDATAVLDPTTLTGFSDLKEVANATDGDSETLASGMCFALNDKLAGKFPMLASSHAVSGQKYSVLAKGSQPYNNALIAVKRALVLAQALNPPKALVVRALCCVHGETDDQNLVSAADYESYLLAWQQNFTADIQAITGQSQLVALFTDQDGSWTAPGYARTTATVPYGQLNAAINNPDRIFLVCPKYFLSYETDGIHIPPHSEAILGEMYAKAYYRAIVLGVPWKPVYPVSVTTDGANPAHITITFNVPNPPLVLDTALVSEPIAGLKGFEYTDNSGPPTISSVALQGTTQVVLTMSGAITATAGNRTVRYAYTGVSGNLAGPTTGARGNLRDSDPAVSRIGDGSKLYNWCAHFSTKF